MNRSTIIRVFQLGFSPQTVFWLCRLLIVSLVFLLTLRGAYIKDSAIEKDS